MTMVAYDRLADVEPRKLLKALRVYEDTLRFLAKDQGVSPQGLREVALSALEVGEETLK